MKTKNILLSLSLVSGASIAGTSSPLLLKGRVPSKLALEINPNAAASNLNLQQSQHDLKIAQGSVVSNSPNGYKILVSSENQGHLKHVTGSQMMPYSMKYGSMNVPLTKTPTEFVSGGTLNTSGDLSISYTGKPREEMAAGWYQDTVRFTIMSR